MEAEAAKISEGPHMLAVDAAVQRLCAVLHHLDPVTPGDGHDALHVAGDAQQVNGHHSLGLGRDLALEIIGVDGPGILIDVCPDDMCAKIAEGNGRRTVSIRGHDDLVAGLDVAEDSRQLQRVGAVVYAEGILRTHECGEILLELFKIFALRLALRIAHHIYNSLDLGLCVRVLHHGKNHLKPLGLAAAGRIGQLCLWHIHTLLNRFVLRRAARGAYFSVWPGIPSCRGSGHGAAPLWGAAAAGSAE